MFYYLSLGTNITPKVNAYNMLEALCHEFGELVVFPFVYTAPHKINTAHAFLNSLAVIYSTLSAEQLKLQLNQIEISLGRDRNNPLKSQLDRPADIDILTSSEQINLELFKQFHEPYVAAPLLALNRNIKNNIESNNSRTENIRTEKISNGQCQLPALEGPTTVNLDTRTRHIRIIDKTINHLQNG